MNTNLFSCKRALVSVSDKTGLVEFLKPLVKKGLKVVSTGGTAKHLIRHGIEVVEVQEQTGFPEVMDGRVKTLHPKIHMCLLARSEVEEDQKILKDYNIEPFDLVIGNLYDFESASKEKLSEQQLAEYIDIGGPSFLRAAAKSYDRITVVCDPNEYTSLLEREVLTKDDRRRLAAKVFSHVSAYDAMIAKSLGGDIVDPQWSMGGEHVQALRYGENPIQKASWYRLKGGAGGLHESSVIQGKPLSYNNLLDLDAAVKTLRLLDKSSCVAVKHLNPCGVATANTVCEAVKAALAADPVSVFGGILAINECVSDECAEVITEGFIECVIAPDYSPSALKCFQKKKNLRVLKWEGLLTPESELKVRTIAGGMLVQSEDQVSGFDSQWKVIGTEPNESQKKSIEFAWRVCSQLKSNAIALISGTQTVGLGMGQVNRVDAVEQSIARQKKHHPRAKDLVLASDAFFPFEDSIELAFRAGVSWVVQPGGSIRDEQVIAKAQELGVNLVLTGQRHFQH